MLIPALLLYFPAVPPAAAQTGRVEGRAPAETVIFFAPPVSEIRETANPKKPLRLEVHGGDVIPRVSCAPMHAPVVLEGKDDVFADIAAYVGVSDMIFRRKFVLPGDHYEASLDRPGLVTLESEVHPLRRAYIYVTPTAVGVVAGADGRYALEKLPAGRRRLTAWNDAKGIMDREVDVVPGRAITVDWDFSAH